MPVNKKIIDLTRRLVPGEEPFTCDVRTFFVEELLPQFHRRPEDWYVLTSATVRRFGGSGLLQSYYRGSQQNMLRDYLPWYDWKEWLFPKVPGGFWMDLANCRRYLEWLGEKLGFDEPEDWYVTGREDR